MIGKLNNKSTWNLKSLILTKATSIRSHALKWSRKTIWGPNGELDHRDDKVNCNYDYYFHSSQFYISNQSQASCVLEEGFSKQGKKTLK